MKFKVITFTCDEGYQTDCFQKEMEGSNEEKVRKEIEDQWSGGNWMEKNEYHQSDESGDVIVVYIQI